MKWLGGILLCCITSATSFLTTAIAADIYPNKPIRLICPSTPGGTTDIVARLVAQNLSEAWKQRVIVDNRGGAGGLIGTQIAAESLPDGYTLAIGTMSTHSVTPAFNKLVKYDPVKDFSPVSLVVSAPQMLAINPSMPVNSPQELISAAKAKPGKLLYSTSGKGSTPHVAFELFKLTAGIDILGVQYKASGPAITDLIAGQVQMMITGVLALAPHVKSGKLKALAITSLKRSPSFPDLPTLNETGVPGFDVQVWFGVFMPAGAPKHAVAATNLEIRKMLEKPELRQNLINQGADPVSNTPDEFRNLVKTDFMRWKKVIEKTGIASGES